MLHAASPSPSPGALASLPDVGGGLEASAQALLDKGRGSFRRMAGRMGLLVEACRRTNFAVVGAPAQRPTALSPKGEQVVMHLAEDLAAGGRYARLVPAVARGYFAAGAALDRLERALAAGSLTPAELEAGRRQVTFLSRVPGLFNDDPVMAAVFPLPITRVASGPPAPAADPARPEDRARRVVDYMAPRMEMVRLVLGLLDVSQPVRMRQFMEKAGHEARALAARLRRYPKSLARLQEVDHLFHRFRRELDVPGVGVESLLAELLAAMAGLHRSMELGELFPTNQMPSF